MKIGVLFLIKALFVYSLYSDAGSNLFCSYSLKNEIHSLLLAETIEIAKAYECPACKDDEECHKLHLRSPGIPNPEEAFIGRETPIKVIDRHFVLETPLVEPFPEGMEIAMFGMGCFWGVERLFWKQLGVYSTQVGYAAGYTRNPKYDEVYTGFTGHTEVVRIVYDPKQISYERLLKIFWEYHDPTQGMQQGEDVGPQYRSMIFVFNLEQREKAIASRNLYQRELYKASFGSITTEIRPVAEFYFAEDYHQQYLGKNPGGYCGIGGTGVKMPAEFAG
ncbi:unnamed protein product [Blepharisma stoltei]|uniref:Mitochondrial peptide methionine sulfoxide reductase n=1 Tax=Blepharisma stoltei TaxID=1481888 RepID=A0AAU9JZ97_9CILI|nr:unnamed protein product [Blepharisma stoltei]